MNKNSILTLTALAAFAVCAPLTVATAKEKPAAAEKAPSEKKIPYQGKVASIDAAAKTFTIKGKVKDRVFTITDKTTITKEGATIDITGIAVGDHVFGMAANSGDKWEALDLKVGARDAKGTPKKKDEAKPADSSATGAAKPAEAPADTKPAAAPGDAPAAPAEPAPAK